MGGSGEHLRGDHVVKGLAHGLDRLDLGARADELAGELGGVPAAQPWWKASRQTFISNLFYAHLNLETVPKLRWKTQYETTQQQRRVVQVPEIALKEEGARLVCGARRLNPKVGCLSKPPGLELVQEAHVARATSVRRSGRS